jgi:RNA polymerase sigma-70 factor (ECF subfamily)
MSESGPDPLLDTLVAGRTEALSVLYDRFGQRLYRTAWGMLGRREDAEDAVQEVFAALVRSRGRLKEVEDMTAYLFTALRRAAGRLANRRAKGPAVSDEAVRQAAARSGHGERSVVQSERLERALGALPCEQREVIAMKIDGELTYAQISQATGVSINTAASRYRYALEKLRVSLEGGS